MRKSWKLKVFVAKTFFLPGLPTFIRTWHGVLVCMRVRYSCALKLHWCDSCTDRTERSDVHVTPCIHLSMLWREGRDWNLGNLSRESEYQAWGSRSAECYWTKIHLFVKRKRILVLHVFLCLFLDETFLVWISRLASPFIYIYIYLFFYYGQKTLSIN